MWKILGLVVFCALLNPLQGKTPGIRCCVGSQAFSEAVKDLMLEGDLLQSHLKKIPLPEIKIAGGLLGLVPKLIWLVLGDVHVNSIQTIPLTSTTVKQIIDARLQLAGKLLELVPLPISVSLNILISSTYKIWNFSVNNYQIEVQGCDVQLKAISIGGLLSASIESAILDFLKIQMPVLLCPVGKTVLDEAKEKELKKSVNVDCPMGTFGTVKYSLWSLPSITTEYYGIYYRTEIVTSEGKTFIIPDGALPINDPPTQNFKLCYGMHPAFLTIALTTLFKLQPLQLPCVPEKFSGAAELQNAIQVLFPFQDCGAGSEPLSNSTDLYLKISIVEDPVCHTKSGDSSVKLSVQIEVFAMLDNQTPCVVVVFTDNVVFQPAFSVVGSKLNIVLTLTSHKLHVESPQAGAPTDLSCFDPLTRNLVSEVLVPVLKARLDVGIPIPQLFGFPVTSTQVASDCLVLCG